MNADTSTPEIQAGTCFHCGQPVPDDVHLSTDILGEPREMCCAGCQAVAEAIVGAGQEAYYRHRTGFAERADELVPDFLLELQVYDNPEIQKSFVAAGEGDTREASLLLEGITCAACIWLNERHLNNLDGVLSVQINYATHRARVVWDNSRIRLSDILAAIRMIGYQAHPYDPQQQHNLLQKERKLALRRIGLAGVVGMQIMTLAVATYLGDWLGIEERWRHLFNWFALILVLPVLFYSARPFYSAALSNLRTRRLGMDVPVALGLTIAFAGSVYATVTGRGHVYYDSIAMFVFFLSTARFFEFRSREHSADVNERLTRMTPATARRLSGDQGASETVPVAELCVGDRLLVRSGEVIPVDGVVEEGESAVDESLLTGESVPRSCGAGDELIGGSLNSGSPLTLRVTRIGEDTVLSHMIRLMERAQGEKPAVALTADRIAAWFVLGILSIATLAGLGWYWSGTGDWLAVVVSLLVVTCPCALSLATPTAITSATSALVSAGMLVTRGHALETLSRVTDVCLDKTGTLTDGELVLQQTEVRAAADAAQALQLVAAVESVSEHPLGRALVSAAEAAAGGAGPRPVTQARNFPGRGVSGVVDGRRLFAGTVAFVEEQAGLSVPAQDLAALEDSGLSLVVLADEQAVLAYFLLGDDLRPSAAGLVSALHGGGVKTHLLTGDAASPAQRVAAAVGISDVHSRLRPEQKLAFIREREAAGAVVAMIGDGLNDSPVLAGAAVSVAMGSAAQLSKFNADVVLTSNSLDVLRRGFAQARRTAAVIRQNLSWALLYNVIAIPAAAAGFVAPWMAAIGMSLSSLLVVLNSRRLRQLPD
ncbi:heavy metal translocating P-type ATPase [Granulosicoccaceae sp. 1_MG-2023]|nr:heavy metal translocating P-type ATPase [Granulosicoccaceae sp. 1_MG-2023]